MKMTEEKRLRVALERLASPEAFGVGGVVNHESRARMEFAQAILNGESHGRAAEIARAVAMAWYSDLTRRSSRHAQSSENERGE